MYFHDVPGSLEKGRTDINTAEDPNNYESHKTIPIFVEHIKKSPVTSFLINGIGWALYEKIAGDQYFE